MPLDFRVFPPSQLPVFSPGDAVFVKLRSQKSTGHAIVVGPAPSPESPPANEELAGPEVQRITVQYETDGTTARVNPTRLVPVFPSPAVLICRTTTAYRTAARAQVYSTDNVVEIGSSYGVCTDILSQHAKSVFGIEVSPSLVEEARRRQPSIRFELLNVLENPRRAMELMKGTTKVFIDIGGNRTLGDVVRIIALLMEGLGLALVCVKSEELADEADAHLATQDGSSANSGLIADGPEWFSRLLQRFSTADGLVPVAKTAEKWFVEARSQGFPKNPLRYGQRVTSEGVPICRLHNYKADGCPKPDLCTYDHRFCHHCGVEGHRARECTL
ncbi:hypothetical protein HDU87_003342 [Geranomyces variabilis]|uniref:CCHC-type domain-containing protein n=1 Tax=Geranomyces variabilis TaxID=109894 RepID=A0AAD5TK29_9FUNG|nr:hypothetical protein HDU87_003342 [Geranomyces variabilis]